jgi:hypothetical protein
MFKILITIAFLSTILLGKNPEIGFYKVAKIYLNDSSIVSGNDVYVSKIDISLNNYSTNKSDTISLNDISKVQLLIGNKAKKYGKYGFYIGSAAGIGLGTVVMFSSSRIGFERGLITAVASAFTGGLVGLFVGSFINNWEEYKISPRISYYPFNENINIGLTYRF